ncbi:MAG: VCBS repeat-containing protein [Planctomycetota bacterium]
MAFSSASNSFRPLPLATSALLAAPLLALSARAQSVLFQPRVDFGLAQPNAIQSVQADFDHDGHLDLAVSMEGQGAGKVEVLFGDGSADFGTTTEFNAYVAWGLGTADFNGDGWKDLAVTSKAWSSHQVGIVLNDQNGGFSGGSSVSTLATPPTGVVGGDFDGDGILDLAAVSESGGYAVDWFHGYGAGTFSSFHVVPNTTSLAGSRIYTGHFNADAHLDLVITHASGVMVLLNDALGTGNFNASSGITLSENIGSLAVADLDGDGKDDLLTGGGSGNLRVWHGLGNGGFTLSNTYATTTAPLEISLGDVNRDGRLDALLVGYSGVQLFFGQGGGAFGSPQTIPAGLYPVSGQIGDWDEDGWPDLAVVCKNNAASDALVSIYVQRPTGVGFCFGDGTGAACPCGNDGAPGHGCGNSTNAAGALLVAAGVPSVLSDTVALDASALTGATCVFFQGSAQMAPIVVDDGLGCVTGTVVRLGTKAIGGGSARFPQIGDPLISVRGAVPAAGGTRYYQCFYRNAVAAFCPPATSNRSNGVAVTWVP